MSARQVLVTGGASGIGARITERFRAGGDEVIVLDRTATGHAGDRICDVSSPTSIDQAVAVSPERIDVLVNAAGVSGLAGTSTVMAVNFYGLRYLTQSLAPRIRTGGAVVNIASTSGWFWREHLEDVLTVVNAKTPAEVDHAVTLIPDNHTAYARSKEAVVVWSAIAAQENLGNFRVNSVSPGPIETPLLSEFYVAMGHEELDPLTRRSGGRNGTPDEIAEVVVFLASDAARWVNGTDIPVDAGAEMAEFLAAQGAIPSLGN